MTRREYYVDRAALRLADAATSYGQTAAAASAACATSRATSATSATAASGQLFAELRLSGALLVEDIKRRQAHIGDFLFTKNDDLRR